MKKLICLMLALVLALSLVACGAKAEPAAPTVDLAALYESYGQYLPEMFTMDENTMMDFLGIDVADCASFQIAICSEGMRADEVWLIQAKDETALKNLRELADTRITAKLDETETYAPDQFVVVEKAQILEKGLYLALFISPDVDAMVAEFEAAFK